MMDDDRPDKRPETALPVLRTLAGLIAAGPADGASTLGPDKTCVLTALGDWSGAGDPPAAEPEPYPDLLPRVRTALDWLTAEQPVGAAFPRDGITCQAPAGPEVTIRVMVGTSPEYGPRASLMFERRGDGSTPVARITRAVADRLCATITALHAPVDGEWPALYLPGDAKTWWAYGLAVTPVPSLVDAYRLTHSGAYASTREAGYRERVARLRLPAGFTASP
jgi:hypothetical protein